MKRIIAYKDYYKSFMETLVKEEQLKIRRALLLLQTDDKVPATLSSIWMKKLKL